MASRNDWSTTLYKGSLFTIPTASSGLVCVAGTSSCSGACLLAAEFIANLCFDQAQRARISAVAILSGANSETARPAASEFYMIVAQHDVGEREHSNLV